MPSPLRALCVALLTPLLLPAGVPAEDRAHLRIERSETPLVYRTRTRHVQEQTIGGTNFDAEYDTTQVAVWTLQKGAKQQDAADGALHWQIENRQLAAKARVGPLGKYAYDSAKRRHDRGTQVGAALGPIHESLTGAFLTVAMTTRAEVNAVKGYEDLVGEFAKDDIFAKQYSFGGTDKGARLLFQEQFVVFPVSAVKAGETWSVPYDFDLPGVGRISGRKLFTFSGVKEQSGRKVASVSIAYDLSIDSEIEAGGIKAAATVTTSESSGRATVDVETGTLRTLESKLVLTGNSTLTISEQTFQFPTTQTWTVVVELLPNDAAGSDAGSP
ncbi:MAG: hypothetical protein KY476_11005 [Planctomycetes bacterium]|nr:hypothetical protein [Planctomycetota bacterium]